MAYWMIVNVPRGVRGLSYPFYYDLCCAVWCVMVRKIFYELVVLPLPTGRAPRALNKLQYMVEIEY